ncbi:MAG: phosphoenolpyruvate--protein phosphotransferase, partial [Alistipes sp.]|nr:phosphoenolpyruvate--protein phosphotransferase [Alistipes sp.]
MELGTDATEIYQAIKSVHGSEGVVVLMDIGSAVLSAETAMDLLEEPYRENTRLCPCPFVEGAVAAGVSAKIGSPLEEVYREALNSLAQKKEGITDQWSQGPEQVPPSAPPSHGGSRESVTLEMPIPGGLHARPVVNLLNVAAKYNSDITIRNATTGKGPVSVRSMTGVISLEILYGQELELSAAGTDAKEALASLSEAIRSGLGDDMSQSAPPLPKPAGSALINDPSVQKSFKPVGVSAGIAIGSAFYPGKKTADIPAGKITDTQAELSRLRKGVSEAAVALSTRAKEESGKGNNVQSELLAARAAMAADPQLIKQAENLVTDGHWNAAYAWHRAVEDTRRQFMALDNENLRLRAQDLEDVSGAVLGQLGVATLDNLRPSVPSILIADELTPDQAANLDKTLVLGVICIHNGPTSHSSILLGSRGIPTIVQASNSGITLTGLATTTVVAMDGGSGQIWVNPDAGTMADIERQREEHLRQAEQNLSASRAAAVTRDGVAVRVWANIGRPGDAREAAENGADGIGLFRTEFMFLDRTAPPTEQEQVDMMTNILLPMKDRDIVVRTLDAGGDKELPYLGMPHEGNPQLGIRAIRLSLLRPDIFTTQLRAILRIADRFPNLRIMFPLISMPWQLDKALDYLGQAHNNLTAEGMAHRWPVSTGMMMEVPSAAIMASSFMEKVDFVSIGTNDLTQYTLAAERDNPYMQPFTTAGIDDSVLALIRNICSRAAKQNVEVAVCGESAADPASASKLMGLGIRVLSMSARSIPRMKSWIRQQSLTELSGD